MKQLLFTLVATFLIFVPKTYAHTYLDSTNPTDGATVTEELQTIELNYSGKIEEGSIFKVLASDGTEMKIESIALNDGVLKGTLASPLPNDSYTVEWDSISEDGHPLSGSFTFTVDATANSESADNDDATGNMDNKKVTDDINAIESERTDDVTVENTEAEQADEASTWSLISIVLIILVVLALLAGYSYYRALVKRKNK